MADALVSLGLSVQEDVLHDESGYSLDMVVDSGGGKLLALQVDGSYRFVNGEPTGATLLKRRQLTHLGLRLVSVPYWEWNALKHNDEDIQSRQRLEYLRVKLEIAPRHVEAAQYRWWAPTIRPVCVGLSLVVILVVVARVWRASRA